MTPLEAIQNEIAREQAELEAEDEELSRLRREMKPVFAGEEPRFDLVLRVMELMKRKEKRDEYEEEIRGKLEAIQAVQENLDNPLRAIGIIIEEEMDAAHELGQRAQILREGAWRDELSGNHVDAQKKREDAKKLGDQHKLMLARLRGKSIAGREVHRVLRQRG